MFFKKIMNSFAWQLGKYIFFALLIALILVLKGSGVLALESSTWRGGYSSTHDSDILTSNPTYFYEEYDSDRIRNFIFNIYNENFYEDTITINDFYNQYNYVIVAESSSTIRVYLQDYYILMDYQGLSPIEENDTKFFFYNQFGFYRDAPVNYYYGSYGIFYNTYIDINYNTDAYTIYNDTLISSNVYYYKLSNINSNTTYNFNLLDSYNNNFAFVEQFSTSWQSANTFNSMENVPSYYYPGQNYSLPVLPETSFSATPPEEDSGGGESGGGSTGTDLTETNNKIQDLIDSGKENIEKVLSKINEQKEIIAGGFSDLLTTIRNWFNSFFNDLKQTLISLFVPEDLSFLEDFKAEWEDKLGFLYQIVDLLSNFFNRLINAEWETWTSITFPEFKIDNVTFWEEQEIDITEIVDIVSEYKIYTSLACVIICVNGCVTYYYKFFGGD